MALIFRESREIKCKIVYYGTGLGGKTTNLKLVHARFPAERRGELVSIDTETERTLYFDFLPIDLGTIQGYKVSFSLYTVPGQAEYQAVRKLMLNGADGLVFVADSAPERAEANLASMANMAENLEEYGMSLEEVPWVLQYNKRDVPGAMPVARMQEDLNPFGVPHFEAVALQGTGVFTTLNMVAKGILNRLS